MTADRSLIPLAFENQSVRASGIDDATLFVAEDVCSALGIKKHRDAVAKLDADERGSLEVDTLGGRQMVAAVTEAGVYTLALRCRDAMTPGTAPYKFRKWVTGVALPALRKGHEPSVVHGIDRAAMNALGGMMKGIVAKALNDVLPAMVERELLVTQAAVSRGLTAGEVVEEAGITDRKGMRGLPRRVSDALRRYCAEVGAAPQIGRLGSSTAYVFDSSVVRRWLSQGGRQFIHRLADEKRGQGRLKLVA